MFCALPDFVSALQISTHDSALGPGSGLGRGKGVNEILISLVSRCRGLGLRAAAGGAAET